MRVIVVGSGIVGAAAAHHLAVEGADVLVVDGDRRGRATAAGAGVVFPWPLSESARGWQEYWWAAAEHYPRLLARLAADGENDPGYASVGSLTVLDDEAMAAPLVERLDALRARDPDGLGGVEALPAGEAARRFPPLREDLAAVRVDGGGRVDGRVMREALLRAAERHGARRQVGEATLALSGNRVTGVEIEGEVIGAHAVVVAAGAWSAELCRPLGVTLPVFPQRGQIAHLDLPGAATGDWPIIRTTRDHYLLAFPGGRVVVGATRESGAGFDHRVTAGGVHKVLTDALGVAPGLGDATLTEVRVGFRPSSRDGLPLLGPVEGYTGLVVVTGFGASGLTLGPLGGTLAADLALGREPSIDLTPFRPDREVAES